MPPDAFCPYPPVADCNLFPRPPAGGRGNQEVKIPTGASPWARNYLIRTANPRLQSQTDLSGAPTSRYDTLHPSAPPGLRPEDREGKDRADTRERIIRLRSGRWKYEDKTACYDVTDFFKPYTYFEILYFYP